MAHIWHALLDDPKAAVTQHFDAIMKALLADMGGGQWRVREAASLATADLLQGRRWEELAPHFEALWGMTLRVIDDIKESVRVAGVNLARTVRGLTLRLADRELTPPAQGRQAIAIALPLLLEKGALFDCDSIFRWHFKKRCTAAFRCCWRRVRSYCVVYASALLALPLPSPLVAIKCVCTSPSRISAPPAVLFLPRPAL
jgi:hypothetical protein